MRRSRERLLGYSGAARERTAGDPVALIPPPGDGPEEQVERREADRPQPRGAESAEAGRAEGADPARRGLLLRRDRRADRLQPDESEPVSGRGPRALPRPPRPQRGRRPLRASCGRCSPPSATARRAGGRGDVREHLRACAHCRATMRAYRAAPRCGRAGASAAAVALAARTRARSPRRAAARGCRARGGGGDRRRAGRRRRRLPRRRAWPRWQSCWRSAPGRPAARPPASRPACSRPRSASTAHRSARAGTIERRLLEPADARGRAEARAVEPTPRRRRNPSPSPSRRRRKNRTKPSSRSRAARPARSNTHRLPPPRPRTAVRAPETVASSERSPAGEFGP